MLVIAAGNHVPRRGRFKTGLAAGHSTAPQLGSVHPANQWTSEPAPRLVEQTCCPRLRAFGVGGSEPRLADELLIIPSRALVVERISASPRRDECRSSVGILTSKCPRRGDGRTPKACVIGGECSQGASGRSDGRSSCILKPAGGGPRDQVHDALPTVPHGRRRLGGLRRWRSLEPTVFEEAANMGHRSNAREAPGRDRTPRAHQAGDDRRDRRPGLSSWTRRAFTAPGRIPDLGVAALASEAGRAAAISPRGSASCRGLVSRSRGEAPPCWVKEPLLA